MLNPRDSNAPASGALPKVRATPRWSVAVAVAGLAASIAGLPGSSGATGRLPPLKAAAPTRTSSGDAAVPVRFPFTPLLKPDQLSASPITLLVLDEFHVLPRSSPSRN